MALWLLVSTVAISAEQIRIVVPFPPGGPNDDFARLISQELSGVVENITGAGGMIATERVANTKRIENTVILHSNAKMSDQQKSILNIEVNRIMRTDRISSQLEAQNFKHKPYNLTECDNRVLQLETKWQKIIKGMNK